MVQDALFHGVALSLSLRKWVDRGVVVGWKGGEQTYLLLECPPDGSCNWSGRERDTDGHTDLGTQLEGTKREATARAVPPPTDHHERNMMMNGKDREEKESVFHIWKRKSGSNHRFIVVCLQFLFFFNLKKSKVMKSKTSFVTIASGIRICHCWGGGHGIPECNSVKIRYSPRQFLFPAEKGMKSYGFLFATFSGSHRSGSNFHGSG
ncbi:hypothetical protein PRIPAC_78278 [Pristionchus pacificus]|uniref:Uncharacterized protein n=1 Tax=Pristionchus pacificus TaxID=54126 RepID=A0A2A6BH82_PRIPA|nr:hypothetical protein PRIPAC_78278 [Pristionchus pacificus]|eukprot:PDM65213.1 hypothetical protein PRIPAC_52155 [Pristionchus pacificus]